MPVDPTWEPVTLWSRMNDKQQFVLNHLEDGWCTADHPTVKMPIHARTWAGGKWQSELVWIDLNGKIQRLDHI